MRSRAIVTILSLVVVVGALSFVLALHSSTPPYDASVKGQLLISGGPLPGTPRPSDGEVTAKNASGKSFSISVAPNGVFTLQLPPGKYTLTGSSPQFGNGQYKCFALRSVTVFKGKSIHHNVFCSEL
jgi:hypothetical protein